MRRFLLALLLVACAEDAPPAGDGCGEACPSGQACEAGACVAAACDANAACPIGLECVDGRCARPAAECAVDGDCAGGRCVEGQCFDNQCAEGALRACDSACGEGTQQCRGGVWRACTAPPPAEGEICGDGRDDDCDGAVDEGCSGCDDGAQRPCETACGRGTEYCAGDAWTGCDARVPGVEQCDDGVDGDCDGTVDEGCVACNDGQRRPCDTECGAGEQVCADLAWGVCSAPAPVDGMCPAPPVVCDADDRKPGGDVRLSAPGGRAWFPRVTWNGDEFAVFWGDRRGGEGLTRMRRIGAGGVVDLVARNFHDADWTGDGYLVLSVSVGRLAVSRVSSLGTVRGTIEHPDLTRSGLDAVVAWNGQSLGAIWSDNLEELHFVRFGADGRQVGVPRQLTSAPGRSMQPSLVADGAGWAVAWRDERDAPDDRFNGRVYFVRLDAEGRKRGTEAPVAEGEDPALTRTAAGFGLAFADARSGPDAVWFAALDADGRRQGGDVAISDSPSNARAPAIAATGDGFGVVWTDSRHPEGAELYFARVGADGKRQGAPVRVTAAPADSGQSALVWAGDRFGVAWSDERDAADPAEQADLYFAAGPLTCP